MAVQKELVLVISESSVLFLEALVDDSVMMMMIWLFFKSYLELY